MWALADHAARNQIPVPLPVLPSLADANPPDEHDSQQVVRFKRLRGQIFVQARLHLLTAVYEAVTHRVYGRTFALQADAEYWVTLHNLSMVWSPQTDPLTQSQPQSQPLSARVSCRFICWSSSSPETFHPHASGHMALSLRKVAKQNLGVIQPEATSAQPSSAGGDCNCVDGQLTGPQLSPALEPLCATLPHASPSFS